MATCGPARRSVGRRPPLLRILGRYHPGSVLLVGVAMGAGIGLPGTFLRTYAAELGIARIGLFFAIYSPTAILTRLLTRRVPERIGLRPMILAGLGLLVLAQLLLLPVRSGWMFLLPGVAYGMAPAVLFPCTVAAGVSRFPGRYRGLGTTLMLATFDLGMLIGAPLAGLTLHVAGLAGWPPYPTLYVFMAVLLTAVAGLYGWPSGGARGEVTRWVEEDESGWRDGEAPAREAVTERS